MQDKFHRHLDTGAKHQGHLRFLKWLAPIFLFLSTASASEGPPPILNPATYTSPSGEYALHVIPSDLHGRGPADYQFLRDDELLWSKQFPFTLWDLAVADSGRIVGYAYTHGWRGFSEKGYDAGMGQFIVVLFSPDGNVISKEVHPREFSGFLHTPPNPISRGIFIDEFSKLFVIRISDPDINRRIEQWWTYHLDTGKLISKIEPEGQMVKKDKHRLSIVSAKALPETSLTLVHWWTFDNADSGTVYTLVEKTGKILWTVKGGKQDANRLKSGILAMNANGEFDLHHFKEKLRVSYVAKQQTAGEWRITKTGQKPFAEEVSTPQSPDFATPVSDFPALALKKLGETALAAPAGDGPHKIRNLIAFDFDAKGRIAVLRAGQDAKPALLLVSQKGDVLKELPLPVGPAEKLVSYSVMANVGDSRFVVGTSMLGVGGVSKWSLVDFSTDTVRKINKAVCPSAEAVTGFPDSSFAVLTNRRRQSDSIDGLFFFSPDGKIFWSKEQRGNSGKPEDLLSPEDITRYGTDKIAILDNVRNSIQIFDRKGTFKRIMDLDEIWSREPNYPTDIASDGKNGFLIYDFNADKPMVTINAEGAIQSEKKPTLADGRPLRIIDGFKVSPQGNIWTSDGTSLMRLSTDGVVDLILGRQPNLAVLSKAGQIEVGPNDRIYISDQRTHSVHVFKSDGKHLGQCNPLPKDLSETSYVEQIAAAPDGRIFVLLDHDTPKFLHFDRNFRRRDWKKIKADRITQKWYFQPDNDRLWIVGYNDVFLVRGTTDKAKRISRRADGDWLEEPGEAAVAPDGSFAVTARSEAGTNSINTFSPDGAAQSSFGTLIKTPFELIAHNGAYIFLRNEELIQIFEIDGKAVGKFALPPESRKEEWIGPFTAAKGKEIWFISRKEMMLHRYAVP